MKKILIIEDEKMLAEMYRDRFLHEGFEVYSAFDAEEGMEMTKKINPDLILLDILLPRANGTDFLEKLRKEEGLEKIKVIAYSNYDDAKSKEIAEKLGAREYLIKTNHTPKEVVEIVRTHIEE
jgi:DNA-binding response OmpR family regulator